MNPAELNEGNDRNSILGDSDAFMQMLKERAKTADPERVDALLLDLERSVQSPDRTIELYTDPKLHTFCCGQVPAKTVKQDGTVVDDPSKKTYLIGVPFIFAAGEASRDFLRGEIAHEKGHAEWTDFGRRKRLETLALKNGMDPKPLLDLDNLIEDPRMERLVGGRLHEMQRLQLFEKNRELIIPNISKAIRDGDMSPADQFGFLIKLERLWALHENELKGVEKPWSRDDLHPRAREEYEKLEPIIARITGDARNPSMKINAEVEKLIVNDIWPAMLRLLREFPPQKKNQQDGDGSGEGEGDGEGSGGVPEKDPPLNPNDPSTWPENLKRIFQKMIEKHQKRLDDESDKKKKEFEENKKRENDLKKRGHDLKKRRDGFEDPALRSKYESYRSQLTAPIQQVKRIAQRFLPKVDEPQYEYGRQGIRFKVEQLIRKKGTGNEKPMGKRRIPEKNALVLEILVDVSGSMYQGGGQRIENAVKTCIATCEGMKDHNVLIEILANDGGNISTDEKYLIKAFDEPYDGRVKSRLMTMLNEDTFGGENDDAAAINVALPRTQKKKQQMRAQADRTGALMIFITDSTTSSEDTKNAANNARVSTPFEGTAITPEADVAQHVRYHYGNDSIIPPSVEEFPSSFQKILQRHIAHLKPRE